MVVLECPVCFVLQSFPPLFSVMFKFLSWLHFLKCKIINKSVKHVSGCSYWRFQTVTTQSDGENKKFNPVSRESSAVKEGSLGIELNQIVSYLFFFFFKGWERHGRFCYKIDTVLRNFDQASNGYYCPPALLTVTSR